MKSTTGAPFDPGAAEAFTASAPRKPARPSHNVTARSPNASKNSVVPTPRFSNFVCSSVFIIRIEVDVQTPRAVLLQNAPGPFQHGFSQKSGTPDGGAPRRLKSNPRAFFTAYPPL